MEKKTPQQWLADKQYRGLVVVKPRAPRVEESFLTWWSSTPLTDEEFYEWLCSCQVEARGHVQGEGAVQAPLLEGE